MNITTVLLRPDYEVRKTLLRFRSTSGPNAQLKRPVTITPRVANGFILWKARATKQMLQSWKLTD